jgi:malto-oligosyltrehalose trehalohydrolase
MKRSHNMPFGAECRDDGSTRFRLWAPAAKRVEVSIEEKNRVIQIALEPRAEGWFELLSEAAKAGTRYSFRINGKQLVPDPASRFQPGDAHKPSEVIDPNAFDWRDDNWRGRPWEEAVLYELHVGTFTPSGAFAGVRERIDYLRDLGVTAIELMPVSDFPGKRNWGYDGVFPFAPDSTYGRPEDLKELVQHAHSRGIMVVLDVVYNHFGPEGNYLNSYAPQFFTDRHKTPWGNGINFDGPESRVVRDFFVNNALYWLTEYHFDGLRLDAVHAISDDSSPDILTELAAAVRSTLDPDRQVHLILENDRNQSHYLQRAKERCQPETYTAQWDDDVHHTLHVLMTGERDGYYVDYADHPLNQLGRCLAEGFAYQGEKSTLRKGAVRGEPTTGVPLAAFITFLQNHDQTGNRAFGERITRLAEPSAVRAAAAILILAPSPPMLFMGEEFGAETPFLFFCDFEKDLAAAVTEGRRSEFAQFARFSDAAERESIPDPNAPSTFEASRLNWSALDQSRHQDWLSFYRRLLILRKKHITSRLSGACRIIADYKIHGDQGLTVTWSFPDQAALTLIANLGPTPLRDIGSAPGAILYASEGVDRDALKLGNLPAWSVVWSLAS